jgi:putative ABC transport system permease protein
VALATAAAQVGDGLLEDVRRWCRQAIPVDHLIRGSVPDPAFLLASALPESLGDEIGAQPGVTAVDRIAFLPARVEGRPALVLARSFTRRHTLPLDLRAGDPEEVRGNLHRGEAVLGTGLAASLNARVGSVVHLDTARGAQPIRVAGLAAEFAGGGQALYLEWATARRLLDPPGPHAFLVTTRSDQAAVAAAALTGLCRRRGLLLQSNEELRGQIEGLLGRVVAGLWSLIGVALVVAALGVANTLLLTVRQQARELGILRALGLTRPRLRRMVLSQTLLLGLVGAGEGVAAGVGLAWLLHRQLGAGLGQAGCFHCRVGLGAACAGLALAACLLAGLLPARLAGQASALRTDA